MMSSLRKTLPKGVSILNDDDTSELEKILLDDQGSLRPVSASELRKFDHNTLQKFCLENGVYSVPTLELLEEISKLIPDATKALEIGAGNGVYGRNLGIKMTDNFMQTIKNRSKFPGVIESYAMAGQPLVQYGDDVLEVDGNIAVRRFKPETIFMAWVTHKWSLNDHLRGGNAFGVDMRKLTKTGSVKRIILVGNNSVHYQSPLMDLPHREVDLPDILFSRANAKDLDRIFVWDL